jgi:hypothetical protein
MKILNNNKGIALVTSLMFTLITLGIAMLMLYIVLQNTTTSGAHKRYKNSLDAAVGGVEIVTKDVLPYLVGFAGNYTATSNYFLTNLTGSMNLSGLTVGVTDACLLAKLTSKNWGASCTSANSNSDPKISPDMTFNLQSVITGSNTSSGFRVFTKIISTTPGTTDQSGRSLEGMATTGAPPQDIGAPYLYRIELTGERITNPKEKASLSVLYAY